ncbi:MAG: glycosyltransferase family 2 protein [Bryobacteraceae bacterium]|nr:glycosyltransferase family 2 protein [Bryobacteraceae bacterium]MDW8377342.1 glycosyltransferase family 2 protein [Bryobacterales bacterium]
MIKREASTALIIPALNEEDVLGEMLSRIPRDLFRWVIVANNGSTDQTALIARAHGAMVVDEPERGYGAACLKAVNALPQDCDFVVFMQADLSEDVSDIPRLLAPLLDGRADLVIGSRTLGVCEPGALLPHQQVGNAVATGFIRLLYGHRYTDLGPFRAIRFQALRQLGMQDRGFGWTVEMQVRALQQGLRVVEVPVQYRKRRAGVNKISGQWKASLAAGSKILWTVLRLTAPLIWKRMTKRGGSNMP